LRRYRAGWTTPYPRRPDPIPRFFIEGAHIQNVAFNVFEAVEVGKGI